MVDPEKKIKNLKRELSNVHRLLHSEQEENKRLRKKVGELEAKLARKEPTRLSIQLKNESAQPIKLGS